jgi:hypothetical protein
MALQVRSYSSRRLSHLYDQYLQAAKQGGEHTGPSYLGSKQSSTELLCSEAVLTVTSATATLRCSCRRCPIYAHQHIGICSIARFLFTMAFQQKATGSCQTDKSALSNAFATRRGVM